MSSVPMTFVSKVKAGFPRASAARFALGKLPQAIVLLTAVLLAIAASAHIPIDEGLPEVPSIDSGVPIEAETVLAAASPGSLPRLLGFTQYGEGELEKRFPALREEVLSAIPATKIYIYLPEEKSLQSGESDGGNGVDAAPLVILCEFETESLDSSNGVDSDEGGGSIYANTVFDWSERLSEKGWHAVVSREGALVTATKKEGAYTWLSLQGVGSADCRMACIQVA